MSKLRFCLNLLTIFSTCLPATIICALDFFTSYFKDVGDSKDLNENFKKHMVNSDPLDNDFSIQVRKLDANL